MTPVSRRARWMAVAAIAAWLVGCSQTRRARQEAAKPEEPIGAREVPPAPGRPPVPASPERLLQPGGARRVQEALARRGYLREVRGDTLDDATAAALRRFQSDEGLAATGFPDRETVTRLRLSPSDVYRSVGEPAAADRR